VLYSFMVTIGSHKAIVIASSAFEALAIAEERYNDHVDAQEPERQRMPGYRALCGEIHVRRAEFPLEDPTREVLAMAKRRALAAGDAAAAVVIGELIAATYERERANA
jgi:hypothetical protein